MTARNKNIPALRFKGFEGTWNYKKLHEICEKLSVGFVGTCERYYTDEKNGILLIRTGNLSDGNIVLDNVKYVEEEFNNKNKKSQIFPGDLLIARHGSSGQAVLVPVNFPKANCLNIVILRAKNLFDSFFLQNKFNSEVLQKQIKRKTAGTTQGVINTSELATLTVSYPSLPEQQKIASFLSAIDEKIRQLTRRKELLEQYKKGVMQQLFSGKLRFKDEHGKAYPKWEEKKIGDITKVIAGGTPNTLKKEYWGGNIRWMNSGELNLKIVHEVENRITEEGLKNSSTKLIPKKCILIGLAGQGKTRGTAAMNLVELCTNQSIASIFPNYERFIPEYLYQNIDQRYNELRGMSTGDGGRGGLNLQIIKSFVIPLPSIKEQQKIASFLSGLDSKIESVSAQIEGTHRFKKGLLQQMFV